MKCCYSSNCLCTVILTISSGSLGWTLCSMTSWRVGSGCSSWAVSWSIVWPSLRKSCHLGSTLMSWFTCAASSAMGFESIWPRRPDVAELGAGPTWYWTSTSHMSAREVSPTWCCCSYCCFGWLSYHTWTLKHDAAYFLSCCVCEFGSCDSCVWAL